MLNYEVDPRLLDPYLPPGTVIDSFGEKTFISLVGFRFCRTRLFGSLGVPFHSNFDEVNLRFYVRRKVGDENRRGVVFIAEIVPRRSVAMLARLLYGENYVCLPMRQLLATSNSTRTVEYRWKLQKEWCRLSAQVAGAAMLPKSGSIEQFITEHYWGYSKQGARGSLEYHVAHEPWRVWTSAAAAFAGDVAALYGADFAEILHGRPSSALLAEGSPVTVFKGRRLT